MLIPNNLCCNTCKEVGELPFAWALPLCWVSQANKLCVAHNSSCCKFVFFYIYFDAHFNIFFLDFDFFFIWKNIRKKIQKIGQRKKMGKKCIKFFLFWTFFLKILSMNFVQCSFNWIKHIFIKYLFIFGHFWTFITNSILVF